MTENLPEKRRPGRPKGSTKFSVDEIRHALTARTFHRTDREAVEFLKKEGIVPCSEATLRKWKNETHIDLYDEVDASTLPERERLIINRIVPQIANAFDAGNESVNEYRKQLEEGKVRDPASGARNMFTSGAILVDKMLMLQGRPTARIEHLNPVETLRKLQQMGMVLQRRADAEGTAVEEEN